MAHSTRVLPIAIASVIALTLVASAYVFSGPNPFIDRVTAESSEELLRAYAVKDTDADGLADWQEALYGTDPANPSSFRADLLDGEAANQGLLTPTSLAPSATVDAEAFPGTDPAAGSLTEQFSQAFFAKYLATRGNEPPTDAELANFVVAAVDDLIRTSLATPRYGLTDARTSPGSDDASYAAYLKAAQSAFDDNDISVEERDVAYIRRTIESNDAEAIQKLEEISATYDRIAKAFIRIPVPRESREAHVDIANALAYLSSATGNIASVTDDPIRTMLGIGEYRESIRLTVEAFALMQAPMTASGVKVDAAAPEYDFYTTVLAAPESLREFERSTQ